MSDDDDDDDDDGGNHAVVYQVAGGVAVIAIYNPWCGSTLVKRGVGCIKLLLHMIIVAIEPRWHISVAQYDFIAKETGTARNRPHSNSPPIPRRGPLLFPNSKWAQQKPSVPLACSLSV